MWLFGGRVMRAGEGGVGSQADVAPTLLALSGLPRSLEQNGSILAGVTQIVEGQIRVGTVGTFGDRPTQNLEDSMETGEVLEQLRSLGYID